MRVTPAEFKRFLRCLAEYPSILDATKRAKISRTAMYKERDRNPEFAAAWDVARRQGNDVLEQVAVQRATVGVPEPIIYQGKIQKYKNGKTVYVPRLSDILLIFLMKASDPARYRDVSTVELTGKNGGPIEVKTWVDVMALRAAPVIDQQGRPA